MPATCSDSQSNGHSRGVSRARLPPRKWNEECQSSDHSLGQALPPGFVASTHIVWLDLRWICPLCLRLVLQLFLVGGGGGCLPSWAASHSLPSPGGKSLRPGCSVLRGALRGATRVPVVPPSRGVVLGCVGQEDSPLPGGSEILLECWLLSGVINWPLSRFRSKTSPQTEPFSLREEIGDSEEKLWP